MEQRDNEAGPSKAKKADDSPPLISSSSDEELDFSSPKFQPFKALYSPRVRVDADARVFDNVEKLVAVKEGRIQHQRSKKVSEAAAALAAEGGGPFQRQFLPSQQMVPAPQREARNVLTYMERQDSGPMSVLRRYVRAGSRVQVCTRGARGERGRCSGFLAAFDKHWNLALTDVDETFVRRRRGKAVIADGSKSKLVPKVEEGGGRGGKADRVEFVGESRVRVVRTRRKTLECQRHVPQLLVRGEHVVFVREL